MTPLIVVIEVVLILLALVLIVTVLMQEGQSQGLGAIGGGAETFFGKNKAKSFERKLAKITKLSAAVFIVLAIVCSILVSANRRAAEEVSTDVEATETVLPVEDPAVEGESTEGADTSDTAEPTAEAGDETDQADPNGEQSE